MKSHEQDLLPVCECILKDALAKSSTDIVNMTRDFMKIKSRVTHEGLSFLTITLPNFGQAFERCLDKGFVTSSDFAGWQFQKCLPAFLQGFTRLVFNVETGGLLNDPTIAAIEGIRQIAYAFKKVALSCSPKRETMALSKFKEVECVLEDSMHHEFSHLFTQVSNLLWSNVFSEQFDVQKYIPKHGPGQTGERIIGNQKYAHRIWYERLEPFFPSDIYLMSCIDQLTDETDGINSVQFVPPEAELPVRITCVPKTLKGPRIIAIEPVCMQYAQQALSTYLIGRIETSEYTSGHINFSVQEINQELALSASSDKAYATLDLSDASDRVPLSGVLKMLDSIPDFRDAVFACRSKAAQMPNGEILPLRKFASMGSALCFPIEAMYFFTVILCARLRKHNLPVTLRNIKKMSRKVYVYGDDIIIPVDEVDIVVETLTEFYCKVNSSKSFWNGKFRESCGMDAYGGYDVTPTYIRQLQPHNKGSVAGIVSWTATSNLFHKRGYWITAHYMQKCVERVTGSLPVVLETSPGIGWTTPFHKDYDVHSYHKDLHKPLVKTYVVDPVYYQDPLDGWSALLKFFLSTTHSPLRDDIVARKDHLSRSPRSGTFSLKRRKVTPY